MESQVEEQKASAEAEDLDFGSLPIEDWIESAERWITENRTLALVGSFALGVFVGVMMKD
jgi:hypothetical protein